jgi:hypothetical protein
MWHSGVNNLAVRVGAAVLALSVLATPAAQAFLYPLTTMQVRDAYFLGRTTDNSKLIKFFDRYIHHFPYPPAGPYVESVEFRTPYEQVVLQSLTHSIGFNSQDAQENYTANSQRVIVRIIIFKTLTFSGPLTSDTPKGIKIWTYEEFLRGFQFRVSQMHSIEPKKVVPRSACLGDCEPYSGVEVQLEFEASQFAPGNAKIEITTPDGRTLETEFDLDALQ